LKNGAFISFSTKGEKIARTSGSVQMGYFSLEDRGQPGDRAFEDVASRTRCHKALGGSRAGLSFLVI
jgi:hypothetical protein